MALEKNSDILNSRFRFDGGPLIVTELGEYALIHTLLESPKAWPRSAVKV